MPSLGFSRSRPQSQPQVQAPQQAVPEFTRPSNRAVRENGLATRPLYLDKTHVIRASTEDKLIATMRRIDIPERRFTEVKSLWHAEQMRAKGIPLVAFVPSGTDFTVSIVDQVNTNETADGTITTATQRQIVVGAGFVDRSGRHISDATVIGTE